MALRICISVFLLFQCSLLVAEEIRSQLVEGYYVCRIDDQLLAGTPQWSDVGSDPPLSLKNAVRLATQKLKDLRKHDTKIEWSLSGIRLKRTRPGNWYYIATFRSKLIPDPPSDAGRITRNNPYDKPRELRIPVLMNGTIPKMVEHRHSDQLLKLLNDLNL
ncbi:MAG: hypothetical protein AAGG48_31520 [Planctomycetota bacterium]